MSEPKYQIAFWISAAEKTKTEDLKKKGYSHCDIYVAGLDILESNIAQKPIEKKKK